MSASYMRKYGTGTGADIYINIPKAGSANHAVGADWTPAAGDVKISKDGGVAANIGTLPTAVAMGNSAIWKFVFTDAELQASFISVTVSDTAVKAVDDTGFSIETYGNASAQHAFDLDTASTAQTGDSFARLGAPAGASTAADIAAVKAETASIQTDTNDIQARLPAALTVGGNIKADALLLNGAAPNNLSAAAVNAEVVDALNVDTYAEPAQGAPAATASIVTKLGFLFKAWRNRHTQTSTTYSLYNDDALTVDHKATVSDDGTTFDRTEVATGP